MDNTYDIIHGWYENNSGDENDEILIVHSIYDEETDTDTLDKTYSEIAKAKITVIHGQLTPTAVYSLLGFVSGVNPYSGDKFAVWVTGIYEGQIFRILYLADSENDYPIGVSEGEGT